MGSINPFSKPKVPQSQTPTPAPNRENSATMLAKSQADEMERLRKQRGRAGTMITGGKGIAGDDMGGFATKSLLGG